MLLNVRFFLLCVLFASSSCFGDETILTTDGRNILLKDNGTFVTLGAVKGNKAVPHKIKSASVESHYFLHHAGDYGQKSIRFMPRFKNTGNKTITAIKFDAKFIDPFGDVIHILKAASSEERIKPGKVSGNRMFYKWEDNQFINGETYDKLLTSVTNKTGKIETKIKVIVFEDGEIIKF